MDDAATRRRLRGLALVSAEDAGVMFGDSETRLACGALGMFVAVVLLIGNSHRLSYWVLLFLLLSAMLAVAGLVGMIRRRRFGADVARAVAQWAELAAGLESCANRALWLQQRGYHDFVVRHWILHELEHEHRHDHPHDHPHEHPHEHRHEHRHERRREQ